MWNTTRRNKILLILVSIIFVCGGLSLFGIRYLDSTSYHPTAEKIFSGYLTYSDNTKLLQNVTDIQAEELSMGQGVYLRFGVFKNQNAT